MCLTILCFLSHYLTLQAEQLRSHGVDKVVAVTVNTPEAVRELSSKVLPAQGSGVEILADKNGGLMRLLGVEIGEPDATNEPRCQRFAGIVEDGILLKLVSAQHSKGLLQHLPDEVSLMLNIVHSHQQP